jgi:hypothetical protein
LSRRTSLALITEQSEFRSQHLLLSMSYAEFDSRLSGFWKLKGENSSKMRRELWRGGALQADDTRLGARVVLPLRRH